MLTYIQQNMEDRVLSGVGTESGRGGAKESKGAEPPGPPLTLTTGRR